MQKRFVVLALMFLGICLVFAPKGEAQLATADILGTVTDPSGATVADATVTVTNTGTNVVSTITTGTSGDYQVSLLPPGTYRVQVTATGFKTYEAADVVVAAGDRRRIDPSLVLGSTSQSVEVMAQGSPLQADTATVSQTLDSAQVQNVPLNGRNFIGLVQAMPGANLGPANGESSGNRPDDRRQSNEVSVNGQRTQVNDELIDGIDNNERFIGALGVRPSIDGIEEVNVQTNDYTAEVGRTSGAVVNIITKSGTNEFHGSLFEFLRNNKLDANNPFAHAAGFPTAEFRQNQFGGSIGGPIKKDKTFFFADYEGLRLVQGVVQETTIPTPAEIAGNFSGIAHIYNPTSSPNRVEFSSGGILDVIPPGDINPIAQKLLTTLPPPTNTNLVNNYISQLNQTYFGDTGDFRIDQHFTDADSLFARVTTNNVRTFIPGVFPFVNGVANTGNPNLSNGPASDIDTGIQVHYIHTFRPNLLMQLAAGYLRFNNFAQPENGTMTPPANFGILGDAGVVTFPQFTLSGYGSLGDASFVPLKRAMNAYQYTGNVDYTKGSHSLKFGAALIRRQENTYAFPGGGSYSFNALATDSSTGTGGNTIASFLLGYPGGGGTRSIGTTAHNIYWESSAYGEDDWRAKRWLTLNLGLRYDYMPPPSEAYNRYVDFDLATLQYIQAGQNGVNSHAGIQPNHRDFSPRIGFAATLPHEMVIRGGYGISYWNDVTGTGFVGTGQQYTRASPPIPSFTVNSNGVPNVFLSTGFATPVAQTLNPPINGVSYINPYFPDTSAQQFNVTVQKLIGANSFSLGYVGVLGRHLFVQLPLDNPAPGPGAVQPRRPYFSQLPLVTGITLRETAGTSSYNALQAVFSRRFSHGLAFNTHFTWSHALNDASDGVLGGNQLANLGTDQILNFRSEPYGDFGNSDTDVPLTFSMTGSYALPQIKLDNAVARHLLSDWQINALAVLANGEPFTVYNNTPQSNTGLGNDRPNRICSGSIANPTITEWFTTSCFAAQPFGTFGNSTRNILFGPNLKHLDFSIFRTFSLTERFHLEFRAETFNIFNTPTFATPIAALGAPGFGSITSIQPQTTPRQIQFALKLLF